MSGPFVRIDDRCATSMRNVWAIGDVTGEPMLAHRAMAQGEMVAEIIAGEKRAFDRIAIPGDLLHRPGDRRRGARARRGPGGAWRDPRRPLSVPRQRAGDDPAGGRGVRARRRARRQPCRARRPRRRRTASPNSRQPFRSPSKWARGSRTSPCTIHAHPTMGEAFHEAALTALGTPASYLTGPAGRTRSGVLSGLGQRSGGPTIRRHAFWRSASAPLGLGRRRACRLGEAVVPCGAPTSRTRPRSRRL